MSKDVKKARKSRKLFRAIGGIDDRMILDADAPRRKKGKAGGYGWFYGLAACIVAAVSVGVVCRVSMSGSFAQSSSSSGEPSYSSIPSSGGQSEASQSSEAPPAENLPAITPGQTYEFGGGGTGGSGNGIVYSTHMLMDASDLKNANPWTEDAELTTLPVFHNVYASTTRYSPDVLEKYNLPLLEGKRASAEEMEALARSFAERFGVTVESVTVDPTEKYLAEVRKKLESAGQTLPEEETLPTQVTLTCSGDITITADTQLEVSVQFNSPDPLPEGYQFSYESSYEEMTAAGEYLLKEYEGFLHMEKPVLDVRLRDRDIHGEQMIACYVYEGAGALTEQILNYHFNTVYFSPAENGGLKSITFHQFDLSEKLGDYPIYTPEEARQELEKRLASTSIPEMFTDGGRIEGIELVYGSGEITLMPYYNFVIEITASEWEEPFVREAANNGYPVKMYGIFSIPAVREEYLTTP